jgi:amino acid adenylation domain-containing protein
MNDVSTRLAQLSPKKQELLLRHLAAKRMPAADGGEIRPRDGDRACFPLSFAQQRLWFLDRLRPGSSAYNVAEALRLSGPLNPAALGAAVAAVLDRHEVLRVTFALTAEDPVQLVGPVPSSPLSRLDLASLPAAAGESELLRLVSEEAGRPFDLARGPVSRFHLVRLGPEDHGFLITLHHIVADAGSMEILFGELRAHYPAFVRRRPAPLPALAVQYTDFAEWQRNWVAGERLKRQLDWWRERLADAPAALLLPTDHPRPSLPTGGGARLHLTVSEATGAALTALAASAGVSSYMLLLAAFAALLARSTGEDDLLVGAPVANRSRPELEGAIGFFVNTVVLRIDLKGEPSFGALLARVRETCLSAFANADLPFERIVEEVQPDRDPARTPLFQTLFSLQMGAPSVGGGLAPGVAVSRLNLVSRSAKFDLELVMIELGGRFYGSLEYSTELFDTTTIARLVKRFDKLLAEVASAGETPLCDLFLLDAAERQQILREWNDAAFPAIRLDSLPARFAEQAARQPDAVALIVGGREVAYGELAGLADRLASRLRGAGVGAEVRVALCLERSAAMVVAVLAVWQAGGAYVVLDPGLPPERAAALLADSGVVAVLTCRIWRGRFAAFSGTVFCLDDEPPAEIVAGEPWLGDLPGLDTLAYVVYTSGSTGRPKGVLTTHGGLATYLLPLLDRYGLGPGDRVLQLPSLVFDASVRDLFGPLAAGATVVLAGPEQARDAAALLDLIAKWRITRLLSVVPTLLRELVAAAPGNRDDGGDGTPLGAVETLLASGEQLLWVDCRRAWEVFGDGVEIVNQYGPTECTMTSSHHRLAGASRATLAATAGRSEVSIGRPLPSRRFYLLDPRLHPVPSGSLGDVYIGGPGMARGYLNRPDLTAAAFLPDPFGPPGERLYATGDRARYRADGNLEFLGRSDQQVKIRGLRVEPGEVEAALAGLPGVRQAAVVVAGAAVAAGSDGRLVAYLVADRDRLPVPTELHQLLAGRLPEAMVPSAFVVLDALPLTPTGKVDRRNLAAREPERRAAPVPPSTPVELELLRLWEELLPERTIGVRDSFFELGGHSLLAVRLMTRIERRFGRALPLAVLFAGATIESLARALQTGSPAVSPRVEIQRGADGHRPLFLVHPAGGTALCYVPLARHLGPAQPVFGLEDPNFERREEPRFVIPEMAALYLAAVREVQPRGPYRLGGWSLGGVLAQAMACQLEAAGEEVEHLLLVDTRSPVLLDAEREGELLETDLLLWFAANLRLAVRRDEVESLPVPERFPSVLARAQAAGRLPADLEPARAHRIFEIFRTEMSSERGYQPGFCRCRIALFRAAVGAEEDRRRGDDHSLGWHGISSSGLDVEIIPGTHQTLIDEPHVLTLAERIRARMDGKEL